jgi:hypothetical protein
MIVGIKFNVPTNKANAADCPSKVFIEGVSPVMTPQIVANYAGEVGFSSTGCLV